LYCSCCYFKSDLSGLGYWGLVPLVFVLALGTLFINI
jgi:hypothetical protein